MCHAPAMILASQRGGMVCLQHVPADVAEEITLSIKMGPIEGRIANDGEVYTWRLEECPCGTRATTATPVGRMERCLAWLPISAEESETIGTFYFHGGDAPTRCEIETDEGFSLEDLLQELGTLELKALGRVKHGDGPRTEGIIGKQIVARHLKRLCHPPQEARPMMDDPQTPDEWQQAVDLADVLLMIDSARHYGLVTGGPDVDQERCAEILRAGQARGYKPRPDALKRLAPTLFNPLPPEEFGPTLVNLAKEVIGGLVEEEDEPTEAPDEDDE